MSRRSRFLAAILAAVAIAGCGDNFWANLPTGSGGADPNAPRVEIEGPVPPRRVAIQDSVLVSVRVSDTDPIQSVELWGFALRGDPSLGTAREVARYETKKVTFGDAAVTDTLISRFLIATPDSLSDDSVYVVARAIDESGNASADTVVVSIGGPRVQITEPAPESSVRAGTTLRVRISASDAAGRIQSLRLQAVDGLTRDTSIVIDPAVSELDTAVVFSVPADASGEAVLTASVVTIANETAESNPVVVNLVPPIQDTQAPTVRFSVAAPALAEHDDSVSVTVEATDSTEVGEVGITVLPINRFTTSPDTLRLTASGESGVFTFAIDQLGMPEPTDSSTLQVEVVAFATDTAGNCATATVADTPLSESCQAVGAHTLGPRSGARWQILVTRGVTVPLSSSADRIADIASDGRHVFLSNISQNRVDVIPVGAMRITSSISVGSRPWGLAFNPLGDTLYVANSGGTNISVVSAGGLREVQRIQTPNMKLFSVDFDPISGEPGSVTRYDYSDRPQFIAVTQNKNLIYSTLPTPAASDGTVRIYRPGSGSREGRLEIITDYVEKRPEGKLIILNADSAFLTPGPFLQVCPRARSADPVRDTDGTLTEDCFTGTMGAVEDTIAALGYDTEFHYNKDIAEIGLTDTTFVAVSGDHGTVAFGEGVVDNARVMILVDSAGSGPEDPLYKHGETSDLIGNAAERVIGLALNADGSMGIARGEEAYYFDKELRLQGMVETGAPTGGVDMHPQNTNCPAGGSSLGCRASFVSGVQENGLAYIDVIDSFHFRRLTRIFMRDPVTGPVRAVETAGGLMIYAVTNEGIVVVEVLTDDL